MSVLTQEAGVRPRRWTKAEYHRLGELGFFRGQKVELIGGELLVHAPQNPSHADRVDRIGDVLRAAFATGYRVRCQLPIDLSQTSEPEPDYAVVLDQPYAGGHPTTALLIVEVADSSLLEDRNRKASLYASAGIADSWIVNLVDRRVEVYRNPVADDAQAFGSRYADRTDLQAGDVINPVALPHAAVAVAALLP